MRNKLVLSAAMASLLLVTACGSDGAGSSDSLAPDPVAENTTVGDTAVTDAPDAAATEGGAAIGLKNSRFDPTEVEIAAGGSVTFTNNDGFDHTITSKDDSPIQYDSGNFGEGETFEQTYDEAGTYEFFCQIHPTMRGTVTVV